MRATLRRFPLLELALGAGAALGLAPFGFWPATPILLGAAIWRIAAAPTARRAFFEALAVGAGYFGAALFWIIDPFLVAPEVTAWMAPFAIVLMALGGGLFWALPTLAAHHLLRRRRAAGIALGLFTAEWLRGWIFTGFPWAQPGQVWTDTPVAQLAALAGQLGLTALTLALGLAFGRARPVPLAAGALALGAACASPRPSLRPPARCCASSSRTPIRR